jgi:sugar phosphate isomerase/epimerase
MEYALSTHLGVGHRLSVAWLNRVQQAGILAVEIFCARQHFDYRNKSQVAELGHWFRDSDMRLHSIHLPMYNDEYWGRSGPQAVVTITEPIKQKRIPMIDELKRALEVAEIIPCKYAVQHLGVAGEEFSERSIDAAFTALEEITLFARHRGVEILLENIPNRLSTAERLMHFLEVTHLDLNFVFDTGHANLCEGVQEAFSVMHKRIRSLHVHDNDGKSDQHLFPLVAEGGTIDWRKTMALLRSRPGQYPLLLELKEVEGMANPLDRVKEVFEQLENLKDDSEG